MLCPNPPYQAAPDPRASILIDSIALIPRPDSMDAFAETPEGREMIAEMDRLGCREYFLPAGISDQVSGDTLFRVFCRYKMLLRCHFAI